MIIDTHAHLFLDDYDLDIASTIEHMLQNNVPLALMPNIDTYTIEKMLALEKRYPENLKSMIGLHPCYINENYKKDLSLIEEYLENEKFIAIGEVGLDRYHSNDTIEFQKKSLEIQMAWAKSMGIPLSIHAREATSDVIEIIKNHQDGNLSGVLHCFSGTEKQAKEIIDLGFYLGIGGTITYKNNPIRSFLKKFSYNYLVLETDAPYLTPQVLRKEEKRNEPAFLVYVLQELAVLLEVSEEYLGPVILRNTKKLFKLKK